MINFLKVKKRDKYLRRSYCATVEPWVTNNTSLGHQPKRVVERKRERNQRKNKAHTTAGSTAGDEPARADVDAGDGVGHGMRGNLGAAARIPDPWREHGASHEFKQ